MASNITMGDVTYLLVHDIGDEVYALYNPNPQALLVTGYTVRRSEVFYLCVDHVNEFSYRDIEITNERPWALNNGEAGAS